MMDNTSVRLRLRDRCSMPHVRALLQFGWMRTKFLLHVRRVRNVELAGVSAVAWSVSFSAPSPSVSSAGWLKLPRLSLSLSLSPSASIETKHRAISGAPSPAAV